MKTKSLSPTALKRLLNRAAALLCEAAGDSEGAGHGARAESMWKLATEIHSVKVKPTRIIIELEGGLVANVFASDKIASVSVLDRDVSEVEEIGPEEVAEIRAMEKEMKTLAEVR